MTEDRSKEKYRVLVNYAPYRDYGSMENRRVWGAEMAGSIPAISTFSKTPFTDNKWADRG